MRALAKSIAFRVRRDQTTGHLYYMVDGVRVFIRTSLECERPKHRRYAFDNIYFHHYRPSGADVVVDIGAGLGTEAVRLAAVAPDVRYIAVEIQPSVYECLCLTLAQLPPNYVPYGLSIGEAVRISPTVAGIDGTVLGEGQVPVEGIRWSDFKARHDLSKVDLLKMNVEGAESYLVDEIDWRDVRRAIISCHDFRADKNQGEWFRTRAKVERKLRAEGFELSSIEGAEDWMRSWVYAQRPTG